MLTIQPTENLTGLTVSGDYWDLDDIVQAIQEIVGEKQHYFQYEGARKRLLNVGAKIREASKGEHEIQAVANGMSRNAMKKSQTIIPERSVYYAVNLLLPEMIFAALALNDFIALYKETVDDSEWSTVTTSIRKFQSLISEAIMPFMSEEHYLLFLTTLHAKAPLFHQYATQYVDLLNLEYLALTKENRSEQLTSFALRLLAEDESYKILMTQLLGVTSISKQSLYEVELTLKYPNDEVIIW